MKGARTDPKKIVGVPAEGRVPDVLRLSTALKRGRTNGMTEDALATLEREAALYGSLCPEHGHIEDPILMVLGSGPDARPAFGCPWCSGSDILHAWEVEGRREEQRDHGCYAKKTEPCVGYLGAGCLNCGRIITLDLLERGDARCA